MHHFALFIFMWQTHCLLSLISVLSHVSSLHFYEHLILSFAGDRNAEDAAMSPMHMGVISGVPGTIQVHRMEWLRVKAPSIPTHEGVVLQPSTIRFFEKKKSPPAFCWGYGFALKTVRKAAGKRTIREDWERQGRDRIGLV